MDKRWRWRGRARSNLTGAEMVVRALKDQGVTHIFGYPGGAVLPIYDALFAVDDHHPCAGAPRAGRGACRRRLCALDRQARRGAGDLRSRRHQCGDRPHRCVDGFHSAGRADGPGGDASDRHRCVPGMRHGRHHAALHQAQLAGEGRERSRPRAARGVPDRHHRPARPGGGRHPEGRAVQDAAPISRPIPCAIAPIGRRPIPIWAPSSKRSR